MWKPASVQMPNDQPRSYTVVQVKSMVKYGEAVEQRAFGQPVVTTKPVVSFGQLTDIRVSLRYTL